MSPECIFVLDHYNDYISGELTTEKVSRVEDHLKTCPNCELFLGKASRIHGRTVGLLQIPAPRALRNSIFSLFDKI
ncbi:MAG: zf-HC2 domain-containing protein [Candidatus Sabulitectum sp.]|nr:zf-HC2 domain-containing protein [Candidatus Sabulitectum sp.]